MGLSTSEIFSIVHLLIAVLSLVSSVLIFLAIPFPEDLYVFVFASLLMAAAITYFVLGLSTWVATDSADKTHWDMLLFVLAILWCLTVALVLAVVVVYPRYTGDKILGYFNPNIYDDGELQMIQISIIMGVVTTVAVIISNLALTIIIMYKHFSDGDDF